MLADKDADIPTHTDSILQLSESYQAVVYDNNYTFRRHLKNHYYQRAFQPIKQPSSCALDLAFAVRIRPIFSYLLSG